LQLPLVQLSNLFDGWPMTNVPGAGAPNANSLCNGNGTVDAVEKNKLLVID